MKYFLLVIILLLATCTGKEVSKPGNETQYNVPAIGNDQNERLTEPLVLDGRPYIDEGKTYKKNEAHLIDSMYCNFDPNAVDHWNSFEGLEQVVNLEHLSIYGEGEVAATVDFTPLASLTKLESLSFRGKFTRLPDLTGLTNLHTVFVGSSFANAVVESLEGIGATNVKRIVINNRTEIDSFAPLNNLMYLEKLEIWSTGERVYKISDMANLPRLKSIKLSMESAKIDLRGIENMPMLNELSVWYSEPFNIEGIGKLKNLERLSLNIISPKPSLEFLRNMPNLIELALQANYNRKGFYDSSEAYQVLDVSPLATVKSLKRLDCYGFIIKNISALDELEALRSLHDPGIGGISLLYSRLYDETEKSRHYLLFEITE